MINPFLSMITEITSKSSWNAILNQVDTFDFYHTFDYHKISSSPELEKPLLIVYENGKNLIAFPFLLREIPNTDFYDLTSVYGYGGPISKLNGTFNADEYALELQEFLKDKRIISVFSRLHPYISQEKIISNLGNIEPLGKVVNIDITLPQEESRRAYQKSLKNQVNKLRRTCTIRNAETKKDILEFIDIYYENMKRLNASDHYFFNLDYFLDFMKQKDFKTEILLVEDLESGKAIAGSMFVMTKGFVQFHLSGTRTEFLRLKPSKLFLDEMRIEATNRNFKYFNLGGGFGSKEDSLFEFKSSFSKDFRTFKVWKHVVNQEVYSDLCKNINGNEKDNDFFPLYRAN